MSRRAHMLRRRKKLTIEEFTAKLDSVTMEQALKYGVKPPSKRFIAFLERVAKYENQQKSLKEKASID